MAIPILKSSDLDRTLAFFTSVIGAKLLWRQGASGLPGYAAVGWGGGEIHLSSHAGDGAFGSAVYLQVDDVDVVCGALRAAGWTPLPGRGPVFASPTEQTWGMRELYVLDPDGNCLRFGSPSPAPSR
jgi:catechol 2,3-dioxygenase-like lactoylglutathione lyase family enzyme